MWKRRGKAQGGEERGGEEEEGGGDPPSWDTDTPDYTTVFTTTYY